MSAGKQRSAALILLPFPPPTKRKLLGLRDGTGAGAWGRARPAPISNRRRSGVEAPTGKHAACLLPRPFAAGRFCRCRRMRDKLMSPVPDRTQAQNDTYQLPGVADVVGVFADISKSVGVPGQGGVDRNGDDLTSQREAGRMTAIKNHAVKHRLGALFVLCQRCSLVPTRGCSAGQQGTLGCSRSG